MNKEWTIGQAPTTPQQWWSKYHNETKDLKEQKSDFDAGVWAGFSLGVLAMVEAVTIINTHPEGDQFRRELITKIRAAFLMAGGKP